MTVGQKLLEYMLEKHGNMKILPNIKKLKQTSNPDDNWLRNWYSNRKIEDDYIQEGFDMDKPYYTQRMKNIPAVERFDIIDKTNPNITGRYYPDINKIKVKKGEPSYVELHEKNHYLNHFPSAMRAIHKDIVESELKPSSAFPKTSPYNTNYNQFANQDEMHSRIMVLRKAAGFKPNQVVDEKTLDNFMKTYKRDNTNINNVIDLAKDKKAILTMLNYMANTDNKSKYNTTV